MTTVGSRLPPDGHRTSSSLSRGATARSAASPHLPGLTSPPTVDGESNDSLLLASLQRLTERQEQLLVQLQDKDQTISALAAEKDTLSSALNVSETRLDELYAEQARTEHDLSLRIDLVDRLRAQIREIEKEKRDVLNRYNEQMKTFDAERLAFYDNEQHLKARIQGLMQARMNSKRPQASEPEEPPLTASPSNKSPHLPPTPVPSTNGDEPAEMTSLRLELSMLSTSHTSLQSTVHLLQQQLVELRRVNHQLQEENESYAVLLRERTLNGQFDVTKHSGVGISSSSATTSTSVSASVSEDDADSFVTSSWSVSQKIDEEEKGSSHGRFPSRNGTSRRSPASSVSSSSRACGPSHGESLADLPITGPGLDLAAELGRAENRDMLGGVEDDDVGGEGAGSRKRSAKRSHKKHSASEPPSDIDVLRNEVKSLKDANKALSLYASKIIDRIISQQGFEHVLAVDYERQEQRSGTTTKGAPPPPAPTRTTSSTILPKKTSLTKSPEVRSDAAPPPVRRPPASKRNSFLSMFGGGGTHNNSSGIEKKLRPLTLSPGSTTGGIANARKLETHEDEEDRRERNRLHATMQLMGIQPQPAAAVTSPPATATLRTPATPSLSSQTPSSRFSFFRNPSASSSGAETPPLPPAELPSHDARAGRLTRDALERAETESKLAELDDRGSVLGSVMAVGAGGGLTEIVPRGVEGRRARGARRQVADEEESGSETGSTVWSAGAEEQSHSS